MSGKRSKKLRKQKVFSKKLVAGAATALLCSTPLASEGGEFLLSLFPHVSFPVVKFEDSLKTGYGGGVRLTYRPNDYFNIFLQGDYKKYSFDTLRSVGDFSVIGAKAGAGYHLSISDRLGLDLDAGLGYYNSKYKNKDNPNNVPSLNGLSVNASVSISYKINPVVSVFAAGGADHLVAKNTKLLTSLDVTPGLTVNLTKAFNKKNNIAMEEQGLKPVFPVFYSWYNDNSFGTAQIQNNEDAAITDVKVYFYQPQYMNQPKDCGGADIIKKGEAITVDLKAFFNEQMLNLNEKTDTLTSVIVEYKYLGSKRSETFPMIVPVYGRNNMSWEDDRCASAFVSSKDPAAMWFAKHVVASVRENVRSGVPQNIQYVMAIFEALDQFGINYVKDPTSAFEDNVGTSSIDFLQFPYQTLMYRGGDCDDLSILVCSLLESVGIRTSFITIPGHIFMAFDSGLTLQQAQDYFLSLDEFIVDQDKVWVPLEITLSDEGFNKAWHKGAWEWNTANRSGDAMMYKMEDSWKIYQPVNVPGAAAKFTLPDENAVAKLFSASVDDFILAQITPQIAWYENRIAQAPNAQLYNDFGILYARYGLFEQAEEQFRLARSRNYLPSILNTANLYYSMKDYTSARSWYKKVIDGKDYNNMEGYDTANSLAMIGLARCAYESGDYAECDLWYASAYKKDRALARQYSYLGSFEQTSGRSFSLADRLENTVWIQSEQYKTGIVDESSLPGGLNSNFTEQAVASIIKDTAPVTKSSFLGSQETNLALLPSTANEKSEKDDEEEDSFDGQGPDPDGEDKPYNGISSQLDLNFLSAQELAALAEESIIQNGESLDDFNAQDYSMSIKEERVIYTPEETDTELESEKVKSSVLLAKADQVKEEEQEDKKQSFEEMITGMLQEAIVEEGLAEGLAFVNPAINQSSVEKAASEPAEDLESSDNTDKTEISETQPLELQPQSASEPVEENVITVESNVTEEEKTGTSNNKNKKILGGILAALAAGFAAIAAIVIARKRERK